MRVVAETDLNAVSCSNHACKTGCLERNHSDVEVSKNPVEKPLQLEVQGGSLVYNVSLCLSGLGHSVMET